MTEAPWPAGRRCLSIGGLTLASCLAFVAATPGSGQQITPDMIRNLSIPYPEPSGTARLALYRGEQPPPHLPVPVVDAPFSWTQIATPPRSSRPWTRWWWPGGAVDADKLALDLAALKRAGFGGAEVQPFTLGIRDPATARRARSFDTAPYYKTLSNMLDEARRLGLRIDLTHLSGYPAGGPQVGLDDALQELSLASLDFAGGKSVRIKLPPPHPTLSDWSRAKVVPAYFSPDHAKLLSVMVARKTGGALSSDIYDLRDQIRLDPASVHVVTGDVSNNILTWRAPPGAWTLVAAYVLPETEQISFSAYSRPGLAVDILRREAMISHLNYSFGKRTGLTRHYGAALRGIFYDSLEYKANRLTSMDFLREFRRRRGYDLAPYLPAVWIDGRDNFFAWDLLHIHATPPYRFGPDDERIRYDYQRTLSDLIIERFIRASRLWSEARGLTSRGQPFGFDLDLIRALGENDIPDTEQLYAGGGETFLKMASSAAALYGRNLVSSESFVWEGDDYTAIPGKIKAAADKLFLAGVNHIFYHGTPYGVGQNQQVGASAWFPFSVAKSAVLPELGFSDNFSSNASIWQALPDLNTYIGRVQNLLRQGRPDVDVLIYYPFIGYPSGGHAAHQKDELLAEGRFPYAIPASTPAPPPDPEARRLYDSLPRGGPDERIQWLERLRPAIDEMDRRGITWGWVNGESLRARRVLPGHRFAAGGRYGVVLVANVDSAPVEDLAALHRLQLDGADVLAAGSLPQRQPGFRDAKCADAQARNLGAIIARGTALPGGAAMVDRLAQQSSSPIRLIPSVGEMRRYSRALAGGAGIHFLANQTAAPARAKLVVRNARSSWWFDPLSGKAWPAAIARSGSVITLQPFESRILVTGVPLPAPSMINRERRDASDIVRTWSLDSWAVRMSGEQRPPAPLFDWSKDATWRYAAGPADYSTIVTIPATPATARYVLQIGLVPGSAQISVNGHEVGSASLPPGRVDITRLIHPGQNEIVIRYRPSDRNAIVGKALAGDPNYARFDKAPPGAVVAAGLLTPISLYEMR